MSSQVIGSERVKGSPNAAIKCYAYGHRNNRGEPCGANVIKGTKGCWRHGGKRIAEMKARGAVVVELQSWGLGDTTEDPGVVLLRLVTQSAARAQRYAAELERIVEQCDGDLQKALVGEVWVTDEQGGSHKSGEYVRALTRLENEERDRCAGMATKAIAAGLAERQVRLAEKQGALMAGVIRQVLDRLGLTEEQVERVPGLLAAAVAELTGQQNVIEGVAT